jgi:hypothetical protein
MSICVFTIYTAGWRVALLIIYYIHMYLYVDVVQKMAEKWQQQTFVLPPFIIYTYIYKLIT